MSDIDKAREEYKHALRSTYVSRDADECGRTYGLVDEDKADTLIAALEARIEELKVCGNCGLFEIDWDGLETTCPGYTKGTWMRCYHTDHCHFTPSRWQRRQP